MNVVSVFDGISCGLVALNELGIKVDNYYSSEINKHAIKVSESNHCNIKRMGDINLWHTWGINWCKIDLLIGGSPCQDFSVANTFKGRTGLQGEKSKLFYKYMQMLDFAKFCNPNIKFLLENVKMKKNCEEELNSYLKVKGVHINSKLVSYQSRPRIYWTNICNLKQPVDLNVNFQNFKDTNYDYCKQHKVNKTPSRVRMWANGLGVGNKGGCKNITNSTKIGCLTTKQDRCPNSGLVEFDDFCRYLTRNEMEVAQNLTKGYTNSISYNQACKVLGNCWTINIIKHILNNEIRNPL